MTETDSGITRGYNAGTRDYDSITRSIRGKGDITKSYRSHNEKL
nr:MAG: hypothetical protein [Bacteriophage sp.]